MVTGGQTLILLVLVVTACMVFTNAVEWLGHRFQLSEGAVGSVLAAVGTALPETMVPVIAILSAYATQQGWIQTEANLSMSQGHDIGVGAILGAPFLLGTLAMGISGLAVVIYRFTQKRSLTLNLDMHLFRRDLHYFFLAYGLVFAVSLLNIDWLKYTAAGLLVVFYGIYVQRTLAKEHIPDSDFHLDPLMFAPRAAEPPTKAIWAQLFLGLGGIVLLAHLFVEQVHHLSGALGIDALILSLLVIPIATELPEKFNSVVWLGKGKDHLAMGNITGAMVFQSCIPTAVGLVFTPWVLTQEGVISVVLCLLASVVIYGYAALRQRVTADVLITGTLFYIVFVITSLSWVKAH